MNLLVSTFSALMQVDLDLTSGTVRSRMLDSGRGIYFGMTAADDDIFFVARNIDSQGQIVSPDQPQNTVYQLTSRSPAALPVLRSPILQDLHQIRVLDHWLCVVLGRGSRIAVFDRDGWRLTRLIELDGFVPRHLGWDPRTVPDRDTFHFNSLTFRNGRAFVLAHNWDRGSFVLEFDYDIDVDGPRFVTLRDIHEQLGRAAHDVVYHDGTLHVLDSSSGTLLRRGTRDDPLDLHLRESFVRGLALSHDHLVVGAGTWEAERDARMIGETRVLVLARSTGKVLLHAVLGSYGNSCDVLLLSPSDLSDDPGCDQQSQARPFRQVPSVKTHSSLVQPL